MKNSLKQCQSNLCADETTIYVELTEIPGF